MDWFTIAGLLFFAYVIYWMESIRRLLKALFRTVDGWSQDWGESDIKMFPPKEASIFDLDKRKE